jgi:hypothetical protein
MHKKMEHMQISLKSAPELTSVPNTMKALQNSIGELEINIHDLQTMYRILNDSTLSLQYSQDQQTESLKKIEVIYKYNNCYKIIKFETTYIFKFILILCEHNCAILIIVSIFLKQYIIQIIEIVILISMQS